jgi:hypothetical protein
MGKKKFEVLNPNYTFGDKASSKQTWLRPVSVTEQRGSILLKKFWPKGKKNLNKRILK